MSKEPKKILVPSEAQKVVATGLARGILRGAAKAFGPEAAVKIHGAMKSIAETVSPETNKKENVVVEDIQLAPDELTELHQLAADAQEIELQGLVADSSEQTQTGDEPKGQ